MKKRFVALAASTLALAVMLPTVALAEGVTELRILGNDMLSATSSVACGEGTASYDATENVLTLENATINAKSGNGIQFTGPLTIELVGENKIVAGQRGIYGNGVETESVVLTGDEGASLVIESGWEGLQIDDTEAPALLSVEGVSLDVTSTGRSGIVLEGLALEVGDAASVTSTSKGTSIRTDRNVLVSEASSIEVTSDGSYGIRSEGDLTVEDASLTAQSAAIAVWADGDITIEDADVSTASAPNSLRSEGTLAISGESVVVAEGGIFGEHGVSVAPVAGEKVDLWVGAAEESAVHYVSSDGSVKSPFAAPATINSYDVLSGAGYARVVPHEHSGDPATCTHRAVCEYCGDEYGELDLDNHVWGEPVWRWYEGGKVCTAAFSCANDPSHVTLTDATVTSVAGVAPTCADAGSTVYTAKVVFEGVEYTEQTETYDVAPLGHETVLVGAVEATALAEGYTGDLVCTVCDVVVQEGEVIPRLPMGTEVMYRLYNQWTGEHFYTGNLDEREVLITVGWTDEGIGWAAPTEGTPVYRLYNPYVEGGDHHYTMNVEEYEALAELGWRQEGVVWHSADKKDQNAVPVYRQYNPYAETGSHNYTVSRAENDSLASVGWEAEGIAWYAMDLPEE